MSRLFGSYLLRATVAATLLGLSAQPAFSQNVATSPSASTSVNPLTRKLLEALIAKGVLTSDQAQQLIQEAQSEQTGSGASSGQSVAPAHTVPYIPEPVRQQIKDELRKEMLTQAEAEGWAAPQASPEWAKRFTFSGDVRFRLEAVEQDEANYDSVLNFNSINNGSGFNRTFLDGNPPLINATEDRQRLRIRARLGVAAKLDERFSAVMRLASGSDRSPVSTNETLGGAGESAKLGIWLDRAFVRYTPNARTNLDFGRAENPFWTSDVLFDDDLNFDGISVRVKPAAKGFSVFGTLGAFPIYNTAFNSPNNSFEKASSHDKWLSAAQLGVSWNSESTFAFKGAAAYYHYTNVQGELSEPCEARTAQRIGCNSDLTRPLFVQQGNSMFQIRDVYDPLNPSDVNPPQFQYWGLASEFELAELHLEAEIKAFDPVRVRIELDYIKNLAFDEEAIRLLSPDNNLGPDVSVVGVSTPGAGEWEGGDAAYMARVVVGHPQMTKLGAWSFSVGYKHIESDAILDAFADSDFHLGGTNTKGFVATADFGVGKNTGVGFRWYSADEITGPPVTNDVFHLDLVAKF